MATYFIDSLYFSAATAVYMDIGLNTHAPDGYYSFSGAYRQQIGGLLSGVSQTCTPIVIIANDDNYSAIVTQGINGNNILSNDTINGVPATTSSVVITQLSTTNPSVNINAGTGAVVVSPSITVGSYIVSYKICEAGNPTNCDTANVNVTINPLPNYLCMNFGPDCVSACSTTTGTFSYFINKSAGNGEPAPTTSCSATTTIPVYTAEEITEITTGMTIYTDSGLTTEFMGASKWYGIGANEQGPSYGKFQVNNTGTLVVKQQCPDYCCGEMVLEPSYFTGENANYFYQDCDTGSIIGVTVYYGEPAITVYGRIPCGLQPFTMTRVRSTGPESCGDSEMAYILYAQTNALTVGTYLFEDSGAVRTFQHGTVFMRDITTGRVWKVNTYGRITEEYVC